MGFFDFLNPLASLGSGIINAFTSKSAADKNYKSQVETNAANVLQTQMTNQTNMDINERQMAHAIELQKMQNAYNSASAQVARARAAGLNPSMASGDSTGVGAVSVPSALPAQAAHLEAPKVQYSDTFVTQGLQAMSQAIDSAMGAQSVKAAGIDNQTRAVKNLTQLREMYVGIQKSLADSRLSNEQRNMLIEQQKSIGLQYKLLSEQMPDLAQSAALQNRLVAAQTQAATESAKLAMEQQQTQELGRILSINADSRAYKELSSVVAKNAAEASLLAQQGKLTTKEIESYGVRVAHDILSNRALSISNSQAEELRPLIIESAKKSLRQQGSDYWNPFKYVGSFFGGAGSAAVKAVAK